MRLRNKKTGGIVEAHEIDLIDNYVYLKIFRAGDYDTEQYNSLAELNEEWEDYKPKEPLIKDEKIRKAVRAWAEAFDVKKIYYDARPLRLHDSKYETSIGIKHPVLGVWDRKEPYTIAELCGEEEK